MKQITKYIGMFAILPLVMVALAPNYIVDAEVIKSKSGRNSSLITVFVDAIDPSSISGKIVGFQV